MTESEPPKSSGKCVKLVDASGRIQKFRAWKARRSLAASKAPVIAGDDPPCQAEAVAVLAASEVVDASQEDYENALLLLWLAYEAYETCMNNPPEPGPPSPPPEAL